MEKNVYVCKNRDDLVNVFNEHGRPVRVTSAIGSYEPYDTDSENDIFDEAMYLFTWGAKTVSVVY